VAKDHVGETRDRSVIPVQNELRYEKFDDIFEQPEHIDSISKEYQMPKLSNPDFYARINIGILLDNIV